MSKQFPFDRSDLENILAREPVLVDAPREPSFRVVLRFDGDEGTDRFLIIGPCIGIGRDEGNDVAILHPELERIVLEVRPVREGVEYVNLTTRAFTIDGEPAPAAGLLPFFATLSIHPLFMLTPEPYAGD